MRAIAILTLGLVAVIAVHGEAGETACVAAPPAPCDCSAFDARVQAAKEHAQKCETQKSSEVTALTGQISASTVEVVEKQAQVEKLTLELQHAKALTDDYKTKTTQLESQVATLQSQVASLSSASDKSKQVDELQSMLTSVSLSRDDYERQTNALRASEADLKHQLVIMHSNLSEANVRNANIRSESEAKFSACERERSSLGEELIDFKATAAATLQHQTEKVEAETRRLKGELLSLQDDLTKSSRLIYSSQQFWKTVGDSTRVGKAFAGFLHTRIVGGIGADNYELMRLQLSVWYKKSSGYVYGMYNPLHQKAHMLYERNLKRYSKPFVMAGQHVAMVSRETMKKVLRFTDNYMERVITNLSSVDPDIRGLFPTEFHDRCYAFAFTSLIIFLCSSLGGWLWSTFIVAPVSFLRGGSSKSKKRGVLSRKERRVVVAGKGVESASKAGEASKLAPPAGSKPTGNLKPTQNVVAGAKAGGAPGVPKAKLVV